MRCVSEPVSWLKLERMRLGEASVAEQAEIETHLSACEVCRAAYAYTGEPVELLPLPVARVATVETQKKQQSLLEALIAHVRMQRFPYGFAAVAAAAAALLLIVQARPGNGPGFAPAPARTAVKGGELAVELVRSGDGIARAPTHFAPGDAWKVLVTCPPTLSGSVDVVVYQDERAYFPLSTSGPLHCGNRVALPGAFSLSGDAPAVVCVVLGGAGPIERRALMHPQRGLPEHSVCEHVLPIAGAAR